ncbi:YezD family protein [Paenibacillus sp. L3-i20]|uniref:YezD family protein n=1 Tax=Paenibacillus sp. L3-i20 TaxID=2905833 RepID=UPI001EDFE15D|nr:YezD family protein [Paenibacillus sp. L3-i20]GKU80302.1 hypothetical protein L3i20_v246990 [Paenibacillus sp. L3-i20]
MAKPLEVDVVWQDRILNQVSGLQYGQVIITVHDGRIVQIDRTERTRYDTPAAQKQSSKEGAKSTNTRDKGQQSAESESLRAVQ